MLSKLRKWWTAIQERRAEQVAAEEYAEDNQRYIDAKVKLRLVKDDFNQLWPRIRLDILNRRK